MQNFFIYKSFRNLDEARGLINLLEEHKIKFSLIENAHDVDITFTGNAPSDIQLLIHEDHFERVNELVENEIKAQISSSTDKDHYLYQFTDDELYDILLHKDEWSDYDLILSKVILEERGKRVSQEELDVIFEKRRAELSKGEKSHGLQIIAGYIFAGALIGFVIGFSLWKSTKQLPDGTRVPRYTQNSRNHGKAIAVLSIIFVVLWGLYFIYVNL